jgi:hypothetical protein
MTSYLLAGPACLWCLVNHEVLHQLENMYYLKVKVKGISWQPAHQPIENMAATVPPICKHVCTSALMDEFNVQIYWSTDDNLFWHVIFMVQSSIFKSMGTHYYSLLQNAFLLETEWDSFSSSQIQCSVITTQLHIISNSIPTQSTLLNLLQPCRNH